MHYFYCKCIIIQLLTFYAANCFTLQCKDERNNPVDWFYMYKLPKQKDNLNSLVSDGVAYMYITASEMNNGWILSNFSIQDPMSMLGRTLAPLYKDENIVSLLYNDQPPHNQYISEIIEYIPLYDENIRGKDGNDAKKHIKSRNEYYYKYDVEEKGHTKGVILGNTLTSFWLVHSIPKFPPTPIGNKGYQYPTTGRKYGQTLLCMSVRTPILDQIAVQLKYNEPLVFYHNVPDNLVKSLPNLVDVTQNKTVNISPWYHTQSFETLNGSKYLSFAKSANFRDDLYSGLVAQSLNSDLLVESWINGPSILDSDCTRKYQVHNIEELVFPHNILLFTSHDDHSKWAIATRRNITGRNGFTPSNFWICVGDINRAVSQETRGGGTVCTLNQDIWKNFVQLVNLVQQCKV